MSLSRFLVRAGTVAALGSLALATWRRPEEIPLSRILPQLEARVAKDDRDAHGHYLLGRLHGVAFVRGVEAVLMHDPQALDARDEGRLTGTIVHDRRQSRWHAAEFAALTKAAACAHLTESLRHLSRAAVLAEQEALYHVALASTLRSGLDKVRFVDSTALAPDLLGTLNPEERATAILDLQALDSSGLEERAAIERRLGALGARAIPLLSAHRADPLPLRWTLVEQVLRRAWRDLAITHYDRAYSLALEVDLKRTRVFHDRVSELVSCESAQGYIDLVGERGHADEREVVRMERMREGLAALQALPRAITPILLPDRADDSLAGLFDGASARFDLGGDGIPTAWPWPKASASFLVWDPECSGAIASGRQMLGSRTWWMFFEDGFRALESLDADGNGWLVGSELDGLALWRDADRDGVSDAGEVASLHARGVIALATAADGADALDGISPTCSRGALFADGSVRPTFDWIAEPVAPRP